MRSLLAFTIVVLTFMVTSTHNFNLGSGISVKNLIMYLPAMGLLFQSVLGQRPKAELQFLQGCFAVLIGYALISTVIAGTVGGYRDYDIRSSLMLLKGLIFDWWVLFTVFFYGARSVDDTERLIKVLLGAISLANILTLAQFGGLINLGRDITCDQDVVGVGGRFCGVFGHANETGTMIAFLLPPYVAIIESARGIRRWVWIVGMMSSVTVMILNASRGASVGLVAGSLLGAILCRKYLSLGRAIKFATNIAVVLIPMMILVGIKYWDVLIGRFSTSQSHGDVGTMTSGRNLIWGLGIDRMLEDPWSFISGFGWNSWSSMSFEFIPHNHYLWFWFELGLVGLFAFILLLGKSVTTALSAAAVADPKGRSYMVAFVFGVLILSIALFFEQLELPWFFVWPYFGLSMRYACLILADHKRTAAAQALQTKPVPPARRTPGVGTDAVVKLGRRHAVGGRQAKP